MALLAAVTLAAAPLAAQPSTKAGSGLAVRAPALTFSSDRIEITIEQSGELAKRKLAVLVFVDRNMMQTVRTEGGTTSAEITGLELSSGKHAVMVKTGTFEGTTSFRRLSPLVPAAAAAALLLILAVALVRRKGSRPAAS